MVNQKAQEYLTDNYTADKNAVLVIDNSAKAALADKLTGKLVIENYPNLKTIKLDDNELTELIVRNCPNLDDINVNSNKVLKKIKLDEINLAGVNKLKKLFCNDNGELETIWLKNCSGLENLRIINCKKITKFKGLEDANNIDNINATGVPIRHILEDKFVGYQEAKKIVKEVLGLNPDEKLPDSVRTGGKLDGSKLRVRVETQIISDKSPQLQADKENAEQERDKVKAKLEAQKDYEEIKTEREQLKQQIIAISKELGLTENSTKEQVINKIKELNDRPTGPVCSHSDYDTIKAERDSLKTENAQLKNNNKENKGAITKEFLRETTNLNLEKWGVVVSNNQQKSIQNAISAEKVEEVRNEIINGEFSKLKEESISSLRLNVGLGTLAIGSLLILGWVLMRQTKLPEMELKKEKK